ncbi:MAG TPA: 7-cyano-7-deazaguanine synthase [Acidimicrobiia bacterium]|jgi:7-cyano-7-deazaguanine synthase
MKGAVALLSSGGLDSAVLTGDLLGRGHVVHPMYVRFGLAWEDAEEAHLRRFLATLDTHTLRPLVVLDLPVQPLYESHWSVSGRGVPDDESDDDAVYLPGRNLLLLAQPAVWCALHGVHAIALGTLKGNPFPDSSRDFFDEFVGVAQRAMGHELEVLTPYAELTKAQVIERGRGLALEHTFSCIDPRDGRHCGACNKCAERKRAFSSLAIDDATTYADA